MVSGPQDADGSVGVDVSAFKDGKLAGGRRADGTFPKLCIPCLRGTAFFCVDGSRDSPCKIDRQIFFVIFFSHRMVKKLKCQTGNDARNRSLQFWKI